LRNKNDIHINNKQIHNILQPKTTDFSHFPKISSTKENPALLSQRRIRQVIIQPE